MGDKLSDKSMRELIAVSRKYGSDPDFVLAGGGNTSWKEDGVMAVKASGTELGSITEKGFVQLDFEKLQDIRTKEYPEDRGKREEMALGDLMASRLPGEEGRPSVESLLHAIVPDRIVVHTHPALVNGLTCSVNGKEESKKLFPGRSLWIPLVDPGYVLAKTVDDELEKWVTSHNGVLPDYIFLANHGVFLWGETAEEVDRKSEILFSVLKSRVDNPSPVSTDEETEVDGRLLEKTGALAGKEGKAIFTTGPEIRELLRSKENAIPLLSSLSPDHIVYMGHTPLVYENIRQDKLFPQIEKDYREFNLRWGKAPKSILLIGKGFLSVGSSKKSAELARLLMLDAIRVIRIAGSFGGPKFMPEEKVNFINTWEVEKYRAGLSEKKQ